MSDKVRWRYGDTNPVVSAVDSASVIEIGDLVYQDTDDAKPASSQANQGSETANQELLADNFLGVAMQRSRSGDTEPVRVATTGVFEFDCPASKFELGDLMGVGCGYVEAGKLDDQRVDEVSKDTPHLAIGRVAERVVIAATTVLIDIRSTVMTGGVAGSSPSGV